MTTQINQMIQLIYSDLTFNEKFQNFIDEEGIKGLGKNFNSIAIIGCQSSGKSTLLNNLFNTNFEVMMEDKGRGQTTQGIWIAINHEYSAMILDCEGTDSKERGEDRFKFEHCSSLFSLAMADVLIINMWTNDVGRYTASNYGVLKIVFEMNLKLFQQECAKRILIVLRDFDDRYDVKEKITELILQDIYTIWKEIKKPERYKDYTPDKFFEFEFTTLSHKFYFEEKFNSEIQDLRKRLSNEDNHYLFRHVSSEKNVPIDGIPHYCYQVWNDIISDKDLNIPTQKEMLANYRCNEIKEQALQVVEPAIDNLIMDSSLKMMDDFKKRCETIEKVALDNYDDTARNYIKHVYEEIRRQLKFTLSQRLYICFDNQAKKLIPISQKNMRSELERELKKNDNFFECAITLKKKYLEILVKQLDNLSYFDNWELSISEYEELFDEIIDSQRKFCLEDKKTETQKKLKSLVEDAFIQKLEQITSDFWLEFNQEYFNHFNAILFGLKDYLFEYYKMEEKEFIPYLEEIENEIYLTSKKDLFKKMKEISSFAVESFRKEFWYHEGIPRIWNKISEGEIDTLFSKYQKDNYFVFELFAKFKLIRNPLKYFNYQKPHEEELNSIINNMKNILIEENSNFEDFVSNKDNEMMKSRYEEGIKNILEDAKRRNANIERQIVPIWAWILIIYVGYEDVIKLLSSYWIIPVILIFSLYGTLHAMGMGYVPKMAFNMIKDSIFKMLR